MTGITGPAWDLDTPPDPEPQLAPAGPAGLVLLLAIGLAALGAGSLTGSLLAPAAPPRQLPAAALSTRDLYVDTSVPAPLTGPGAVPAGRPRTRIGDAVVVLRLQVDNPGPEPIQLAGLTVDGVRRNRTEVPLDLVVAGRRSRSVDITLHPDCSADREPAPVRAGLRLSGAGSPDAVPVSPSRALSRVGGLCRLFDTELPRGWRAPIQARGAALRGQDLELTLDDLSGERLAGLLVDDQLISTVYIGDVQLSSTAEVRLGEATRLRLRGPPPCIPFSGTTPIPSTLRLLARGDDGVEPRLVLVGPALTRWLRLDCGQSPTGSNGTPPASPTPR
jgi:hypothetical protein